MVANEFWVLLLGVKNEKPGIRLEKNICRKKKRQNLPETDRGLYYNQKEWLEQSLDDSDSENDENNDDSKNDEENYNENTETIVCRCSSK